MSNRLSPELNREVAELIAKTLAAIDGDDEEPDEETDGTEEGE